VPNMLLQQSWQQLVGNAVGRLLASTSAAQRGFRGAVATLLNSKPLDSTHA
jgi:hypothetical protein